MLNFPIKSHITENFFTNHASRKKKLVRYQFFLLYHNNVSSKIRTLAIQPQKSIGKYSKHFTPKMPIIGKNRSSDFKAYWEIWFTSDRLLDNQAPDKHEKTRRVKQAWQGGILTFPDLSRLAPPTCYFLQI